MTKFILAWLMAGFSLPALAGLNDPGLIGPADCRVINPAPQADESVRWSGSCKDGFADGSGQLEWLVGGTVVESYNGRMARGRPDGVGDYHYSSKLRYQGEFVDGEWQGHGVLTGVDGDQITAQFVHGEPAPNTDVEIAYRNGNHYVGGFKSGKRNGQGTIVLKNGTRYVGQFKDGFWDGQGKVQWAGGGSYEGQFKQGSPDGQGYVKYASGDQYEGQFQAGKRTGTGVFRSAAGDRYEGQWKQNLRDGSGVQTFALGGRYSGHWKADKYDGQGEITYPSGRSVAGEFTAGHPVGVPLSTPAAATRYALHSTVSPMERDTLVSGSAVPLDRPYEEMNEEQKASVRALYPLMEESDEPPFPARGEREMMTQLSNAGRNLNVSGVLSMHVRVSATGVPESVAVFASPSPELTKVAAYVVMKQQFKPARCGGQPCAMLFPFAIHYVKD